MEPSRSATVLSFLVRYLVPYPAPSPQNMIRGWKIALRSFAVPSSWLLKEGAQSGGEYAIFYRNQELNEHLQTLLLRVRSSGQIMNWI